MTSSILTFENSDVPKVADLLHLKGTNIRNLRGYVIMKLIFQLILTISLVELKTSFQTKFAKFEGKKYRWNILKCDNEKFDSSVGSESKTVLQDDSNSVGYALNNFSYPTLLSGMLAGTLLTLTLLFAPFALQHTSDPSFDGNRDYNLIEKSTTLFEDILVDLKNGYVDNVNPDKLFETAVKAMLGSLDPYTEYENLGEAQAIAESVSGKYGGVGMVISGLRDGNSPVLPVESDSVILSSTEPINKPSKGVIVVDAFEGYAFDNNIRTGDRVLSVNGVDVTEKNVDDVRTLLRGDPGTDITLLVERDSYRGPSDKDRSSKQTVMVTTKRQQVRMSDVRLATYLGSPRDGIGYISLAGFNADASKDFASALLMLRYSSPFGLHGLVLDLRGNPGGLLDQAVDVASFLVPAQSPIVSAKSKTEPEVVFKSSMEPLRPAGMRLAVLVNGGSASASEIVSGAVQDLDAGVVLGPERTYGKGLVQKIVPLPYDSALKYTVAKYYTPSGRCIQAVKYGGAVSATAPSEDGNEVKSDDTDAGESDLYRDRRSRALEEAARTGDGAALVREGDRQVYYTAGGRPVKDSGGIEPDILLNPFKLSQVETALVTQGVYSDYASDLLRRSPLRPALARVAQKERIARQTDPRFDERVARSPIARFFVLPTSYAYDTLSAYHAMDGRNKGTNELTRSTLLASLSTNNIHMAAIENYNGVVGSSNNPPSANSANDWEKELLTLKQAKKEAKLTKDTMFADFKRFVSSPDRSKRLRTADSETALARVNALSKELAEEGYPQAAQALTTVKSQLSRREAPASELDQHRSFVSDSIELTLLSRELPDRLLLYRSVLSDPQVEVARKLLAGETGSPGVTAVTATTSSVAKGGGGDPIARSDAGVMLSPTSPSLSIQENSIRSYDGLYEATLRPRLTGTVSPPDLGYGSVPAVLTTRPGPGPSEAK